MRVLESPTIHHIPPPQLEMNVLVQEWSLIACTVLKIKIENIVFE